MPAAIACRYSCRSAPRVGRHPPWCPAGTVRRRGRRRRRAQRFRCRCGAGRYRPVVGVDHAHTVGGDDRADGRTVVTLGADPQVVGILCARAVVLAPAQDQSSVVGADQARVVGLAAHLVGALLGGDATDEPTVGDHGDPALGVGPARCPLQFLDHREMHAQDVRKIRVGLAQRHDQVEELLGRQTPTAEVAVQGRRAHAVCLDQLHAERRARARRRRGGGGDRR